MPLVDIGSDLLRSDHGTVSGLLIISLRDRFYLLSQNNLSIQLKSLFKLSKKVADVNLNLGTEIQMQN